MDRTWGQPYAAAVTHSGRILAAVVLAASPLLVVAPKSAAEPEGTSSDAAAWTASRAQTIGNSNLILNSVFVPEAGEVWAVGYRYTNVGGATEFRTVVEHSSGGGDFQLVPSPDREGAPATNFLEDVSGSSSTDLWAVGWSRDPRQPSRTLIEHWDGASWQIWSSPDPGQYGNILEGVTAVAADDVWAVGAREDTFYQAPLAQHWDGSTWSTLPVPNPTFCSGHSYLSDVAARSTNVVFATGVCSSSSRGGDTSFVVRWNGARWGLVASIDQALPTAVSLFGVSTYGGSVWFAGYDRDKGAFAMRNRAGGWLQVPLAAPDSTFAAVVARGASAWAVGTAPSPQPPFAGPGASRLTAGGGTASPIPVDFGSLRGVGYDPAGKVWAVGTQLPGQYNTPLIVSRPVP